MDVFEKILLTYGGFILICVRNVLQEREDYERCVEINKVLEKYNISTTMTIEDWQAEMWRTGTSGKHAISNAPFYFFEAMQLCKDAGLLNKCLTI
jgi:hypothetical protein|nr:MAG TPA: hypothetical protein [Caudoviricetes sp.]